MEFGDWRGHQVLITGGLGFIGSNLAIRCVELGSAVTLLTRSEAKAHNIAPVRKRVRVHNADLSDADQREAAWRKLLPGSDVVFHLTAQTSHIVSMQAPLADLEANCSVTLSLLEACRRYAPEAAVVMPGTVTQAGRVAAVPAAEDLPDLPVSLYDAHKLTCEKYLYIYAKNYGLKTTTLRLANVFGERQQMNNPQRGILNFMLKRALTGEPLTIYEPGNFVRDYSYVQNVVDALLLAAASPHTAGQSYIFGSGQGLKFYEMIDILVAEVRGITGQQATVQWVPFPGEEKRIDAGDFIADNRKFRAHTGWLERVDFETGVQNTIYFYRDHLDAYL
ncbi:MAG: NAD-dependent epimerase/dehydratase family protein [Anaerolineales bacterium]